MNLVNIRLSEMAKHRKINTALSPLCVESKIVELITETRMVFIRGRGLGWWWK